jgi:hypothetical protein
MRVDDRTLIAQVGMALWGPNGKARWPVALKQQKETSLIGSRAVCQCLLALGKSFGKLRASINSSSLISIRKSSKPMTRPTSSRSGFERESLGFTGRRLLLDMLLLDSLYGTTR